MVGLSRSIILSFTVVGHTKFAPDAGFGLIKQKYKKKPNVECLQDIVEMINESAALNETRLVGTQDGQMIVPTYDWSTHLGVHFKKVQNIKQYHQFYFVAEKPGRVFVKRFSDSEQLELDLRKSDLSWSPSSALLPPVVHPKGLSEERQWYLFEKNPTIFYFFEIKGSHLSTTYCIKTTKLL